MQQRPPIFQYIFLLIITLSLSTGFLVGCGGGGGGDGSSGPVVIPEEPDEPDEPDEPASFTVAGTVQAAAGSAADGDVNDTVAPYQPNDTPATAQPIPNPVILGGYANTPGSGADGRSRFIGDPFDYYRVTLAAGQTISLFIAGDGLFNDLDLVLFDTGLNLIDGSLSQRRTESLSVAEAGEYIILVEAFRGASNYTLTVGQETALSANGFRLSDNFMPDQIIVQSGAKASAQWQTLAQNLSLQARHWNTRRNTLLDIAQMDRTAARRLLSLDTDQAMWQPGASELQRRQRTLRMIKTLRLQADVALAEPNYLREIHFTPNDGLYFRQWHYPLINLPAAWDLTTGAGAVVAVLDTGILFEHPDFQGQLLPGYDFVSDITNAGDGDGIDPDPADPGDGGLFRSSSFHGTHVAGTVAATTDNSIGVAGSAFGARIMPLRVVGRLGASDYDIEQAIRFAAGLSNDSGTLPAQRADVINLSLGGPAFAASTPAVIQAAREAGVVVVASAGNESSERPSYPAAYDGVISVSAVDINKALAPYSSFGPTIDVAAPGGDTARDVDGDGKPDGVLSTGASDAGGTLILDYFYLQGTSMAAPHVAGVVALMRAANAALTPALIDSLLASGRMTEDLGTPGRDDEFGHGLINAYQAVLAALDAGGTPPAPTPILTINPTALNFGLFVDRLTLTVSNGGNGDLFVNPPIANAPWLNITAPAAATGLGSYTVTVDRSGLADGVYTATIALSANAGEAQIPVIMQVANNLAASDLGQLYVLAVDAASRFTVQSTVATRREDGSYTYRFEALPAGVYEIFAGTDFDNDNIICDVGEACGAYLTLDAPIEIGVENNQEALDFTSGFSVNLQDLPAAVQALPATGSGQQPGLLKR